MCLDADTIVDQDAPYYMIENFKHDPKLGAVTGNLEFEIRVLF